MKDWQPSIFITALFIALLPTYFFLQQHYAEQVQDNALMWLLKDAKPKEILLTSLLLVIGYLFTHIVRHNCEKIRDRRLDLKERTDTAELIEAEMRCIFNHYDKNKLKLNSLISSNAEGRILDYDKLKYHKGGLYSANSEGLHRIEKKLAQDILVMNLFVRNNEMEIDEAISRIFYNPELSEVETLQRALLRRMDISTRQSKILSCDLDQYASSPDEYKHTPLNWDEEWFKHQLPKNKITSIKKSANA